MKEAPQAFDPRQHMNKQHFEVFHYCDTKAKEVMVHHHDFYEVYVFLSGKMDYWVEGKIYCLEPGDVLLISPREMHRPLVDSNCAQLERYVLWIDPHYLQTLSSPDMDMACCFNARPSSNVLKLRAAQFSMMRNGLDTLVRETYGHEKGNTQYAEGMFLQLMVELNRWMLHPEQEKKAHTAVSLLASRVLDYIGTHYQESFSLDDLSQKFFVSKYHLSHTFSQEVGTSIYRYTIMKRLQAACQQLLEGKSPGEVYQLCGFRDYANFYRAFHTEYGVSPGEWARDKYTSEQQTTKNV